MGTRMGYTVGMNERPNRVVKGDLNSVYYPVEANNGGDWIFVLAVIFWPITVPLGLLAAIWFFILVPLWKHVTGKTGPTKPKP